MFTAIVYGKKIKANTLRGLKMLASKRANAFWRTVDEIEVTTSRNTSFKLWRINRKCPNGTITYGQWK